MTLFADTVPGSHDERIGSVKGNGTHDFAVTCMDSEKLLLFHSEKGKTLELSSLDVLSGAPSAPPERGVLLATFDHKGATTSSSAMEMRHGDAALVQIGGFQLLNSPGSGGLPKSRSRKQLYLTPPTKQMYFTLPTNPATNPSS
jgi:hypothetical protein